MINIIVAWLKAFWEKHICAEFPKDLPQECFMCNQGSCEGCPILNPPRRDFIFPQVAALPSGKFPPLGDFERLLDTDVRPCMYCDDLAVYFNEWGDPVCKKCLVEGPLF